MEMKDLNCLKVVLVEKNISNIRLAEKNSKNQTAISKWVTNTSQLNLDMLVKVSQSLDVSIEDLIWLPENP